MASLEGSELLRFQPNRYPFLMLDKVTDYVPGKYARGLKNFTNNEWFFPAHFPGHPNVPGVLQIEAMTQMMTVALTTLEGLEGKIPHGLKYSGTFRKEVIPGDTMLIFAEIETWRRGICEGRGVCEVGGETVSTAHMTVAIPGELSRYVPN